MVLRFALRLLPFALCSLFFSACYEPKEGCLEIEATNFDASADKNCCCEYPKLVFNIAQRFDTLNYLEGGAYEYAPGRWLRLKNAAFYLSDFQLFHAGSSVADTVTDTLTLALFGPAPGDTLFRPFRNDFELVRRNQVDYSVGNFRPSGDFNYVQVRLGLPSSTDRVIPTKAPANHPLRPQPDSLWLGQGQGFVFLQLVVSDTTANAPNYRLNFTRMDFDSFLIASSQTFTHHSGYDFRIGLTVDYRALFYGVDFQWAAPDPAGWKQQIVANLPNAFAISPL